MIYPLRLSICSLLAAIALLHPATSPAQTLYTCTVKGRPTSYQSLPCAEGARTAEIREYTPDPPPTAQQLRQRQRDSAYLSALAGTGRSSSTPRRAAAPGRASAPSVASCSDVRQQRDEWERNIGLKRRYDDLRAWTDRVRRACQ